MSSAPLGSGLRDTCMQRRAESKTRFYSVGFVVSWQAVRMSGNRWYSEVLGAPLSSSLRDTCNVFCLPHDKTKNQIDTISIFERYSYVSYVEYFRSVSTHLVKQYGDARQGWRPNAFDTIHRKFDADISKFNTVIPKVRYWYFDVPKSFRYHIPRYIRRYPNRDGRCITLADS